MTGLKKKTGCELIHLVIIAGDCGTMKKGKATTRCLPKKKAQSLSKAERKATVAKKVRGSKKGKQFVSNTKTAKYQKGTYQKKS